MITCPERSCIAIVLFLFSPSPVILYQPVLLVNLHWLLIDLRIDFKRILLLLNRNENLHLKHSPLGVC